VKKNKVFLLMSILTLIIIFGTALTCNMCGLGSKSTSSTDTSAGSETSAKTSSETVAKVTEDTSKSSTTASATETQEETAAVTEKTEAPTIKLEIYEGPTYSAAEDICYYRVKATVTGSPDPKVTFSKDDSAGAWGSKKVQVNLTKSNPSYTLTAKAKNSAGEGTASLTLNWGCNRNPVINDITLSSSTVEINKIYAVTADATDPDGDTLTYSWTVSSGGGSISFDTSNPMKWTTPAAAGDYVIQVKVTDGKGGETTKSKTVSVNLPAALNMTVTKITSEGGWLEQNGLIHNSGESFYAGDSDLNKACRAYISFDITELTGATINSAAITGIIKTKWGDPSVLDKMWIGIVDWGAHPIILQDFDLTGTPIQSLSTAGDGNFTCNIDALKTQLQNAISGGKTRFQVRIHMSVPNNSNNAWDGFEYKQSGVNLDVSYTK
jgi:hypothetical protein